MAPVPTTAVIVFALTTLGQLGGRQSTPYVTSYSPPQTTPPPPPTTNPPGCWLDDGSEVEDLLPGGSRQTGCRFCTCDWAGYAECHYADCLMPRCVDPQEGECCSTCPNGNNCRTPSGQIIGDGDTVIEGSTVCTCFTENYTKWDDGTAGDGPQAACRSHTLTTTTTPPPLPACLLDNGTVMEKLHPQGHWKSADGCRSCYCEVSGRAHCSVTECSVPVCVHPASTPGVCCSGCHEGADNHPGETMDNAGAASSPLGRSLCLSLACSLWQVLPLFKFLMIRPCF